MESIDIVKDNIDKIGELFPNVIVESENGKTIDFDLLKQELSNEIVEGNKEKYQLTWPGKKEAILNANTRTKKTLRPIREKSVDFDNTQNIYIEGDNLEALKILQESYLGKIKCIYIDPPYNTGNDFIYNDNFNKDKDTELEESGQIDEEGNKLITNSSNNGRFHSDWLSMIYPRLKLARNLLTNDGIIFMSIDDNELINLKKICDEIFGENNFVNIVSAKMKNIAGASGGGEDKRLKKNIEYILIYAKDYYSFTNFSKVYKKTEITELLEFYRKENISWKYTSVIKDYGEKQFYGTTIDGDGNEIKIYKRINPVFASIGQIIKEENISEEEAYSKYYDRIYTTEMPQSSIRARVFEKVKGENLSSDSLYSIEYVPKTGKNKNKMYEQFYKGEKLRLFAWFRDVAVKENNKVYKLDMQGTFWDGINLNNLTKEGDILFENGKKPLDLMKKIMEMIDDNEHIVLDFFSGSATTAHSVMQLNAEDGGNRKFIMVQLPEKCEENSVAYKNGYETICDIGEERIRRAGKKIKEETNADIDYGFRVYKVDSSNMKDIYYKPSDVSQTNLFDVMSNVKEDRTTDDLLTQVILDLGLTLDLKIEEKEILSNKVFYVENNSLVACFDDNVNIDIVNEICKCKPLKVVFKDSSFKTDKDKINLEERIKKLSVETEINIL